LEHCTQLVNKSISDLSAFNKLKEIISAQGGDVSVLDDYSKFPQAKCSYSVKSPRSGYIYSMNAEKCGTASMLLGAGRETKLSVIDYSAGIILKAKTGDYANKGDELAVFYTNKPESLAQAEELFLSAIAFDDKKPEIPPHILAKVEKGKTQHYV
ncbi:MAG TPA: thymidine phosphorylase, partial [Ruminococcaceae bacterium]|nr:thymidine phosphorylase [Oscillospiraceae bacterium]